MGNTKTNLTVNSKIVSSEMKICKRVRKLRIESGLTQQELAAKIKITRGNLNHIERGGHAPTVDVIRSLRKVFKVTYSYLIDGRD